MYELLRSRALALALVLGDTPQRPFQADVSTAAFAYVRFHHGTRGRGGNYSKSELDRWAERLREWRRDREVLAYFNNDWSAFAPRNALYLRRQSGEG